MVACSLRSPPPLVGAPVSSDSSVDPWEGRDLYKGGELLNRVGLYLSDRDVWASVIKAW